MSLLPKIGKPCVEVPCRPSRKIHQQLRKVELRVDIVAAAGASQACQDRSRPSAAWVAFASAEEFLSLTHRDNIACLILDVGLPGISGLELQRQLTATVSNHRTPVVFMTARDDEATRQRALKGGAVDFLRKPIRRETLLNAVHLALQQNDGKTSG